MLCNAILYSYYNPIYLLLGRQRMSDIEASWEGHPISSVGWGLQTWSWTYQKQLFVLLPLNRLLVNLNTALLWIVWEKLTVDVLTSDTQLPISMLLSLRATLFHSTSQIQDSNVQRQAAYIEVMCFRWCGYTVCGNNWSKITLANVFG